LFSMDWLNLKKWLNYYHSAKNFTFYPTLAPSNNFGFFSNPCLFISDLSIAYIK
jgi:hypothetical protein